MEVNLRIVTLEMEAFPAWSWKNQNVYVNQQMPRIPGELVAKRTRKKKGSDPKNTNLQFTPPQLQLTWK